MVALRHRPRQLLAVTAGACVGLTGVLMSAAPASADQHHSEGEDSPIVVSNSGYECNYETGEWVIEWAITNNLPGRPPGASVTINVEPEDSQLGGIRDNMVPPPVLAKIPHEETLTFTQWAPGDAANAELTLTGGRLGDPPPEPETIPLDGHCAAPSVASESGCDSLTVSVTHPVTDREKDAPDITAMVTVGDDTEELTVAPGETGDATFDAEEGTVATVALGDEETELAWEQPEDCEEDGAGGGSGDGEDLPETGVPTGLLAGGAVLLIALGGVLYALARRRRSFFTA